MGIESNISHLTKSASGTPAHEEDTIDLGDGWKGIDGDPKRAFEVDLPLGESDTLGKVCTCQKK
jgi:hypothetical protein